MKEIRKSILFALLIAAISLVSCSDDDSSSNGSDPELSNDIYPMKTGYWWKYRLTYDTEYDYTVSITGTNEIDGENYDVVKNSLGGVVFARADSDWVYAIDPFFGENEIKLAKRKCAPLDEWEEVSTRAGNINYYAFIVADTGQTLSIQGKTYKRVVKIQITAEEEIPGSGKQARGTFFYYFARGIGLVKKTYLGRVEEILDYKFK